MGKQTMKRSFYSPDGTFPNADKWLAEQAGAINVVGTETTVYKRGSTVQELNVYYKEKKCH